MYISESKKALAPNAAHDSGAKVMLYQFYYLNQSYGLCHTGSLLPQICSGSEKSQKN